MATIELQPEALYRSRGGEFKEVWHGYIEADGGTVSAMTKADLAQVDTTGGIVFDAVNNEIDLEANSWYEVTVELSQTGASASAEIYNVTGAAVIRTSPVAAGYKSFTALIRTTTAISIAIRLDDQTANTIGAANTLVLVKRLGAVAQAV